MAAPTENFVHALNAQGGDPWVMGILNVTPDSFSDGGQFQSPECALARVGRMLADGADLVDVGPESTRPGSDSVSESEQIARAVPIIKQIHRNHPLVPISIDTRSARVAALALEAGATFINDVSALRDDPEMVQVAARAGVPVVLMHRRGDSKTMQAGGGPRYDDFLVELIEFFQERMGFAEAGGLSRATLVLDPGIGFGKRLEHNLQIIRHADRILALGRPVVLGASRKSFIGTLTGVENPQGRMPGSIACALWALRAAEQRSGPRLIFRVHDVGETVQALRMSAALAKA
jgi:dihydropteroate synthase